MSPRAPFIPPLALVILLSLVAFGLGQLHWIPLPNIPAFVPVAICLLGAIITALAFMQFRRHNTSVNPMQFCNNTTLLDSGVFAWSRNPIYLGMLVFLLGAALFNRDGMAFIPCVVFYIWINYWQIAVEEFHLQRQFGTLYTQYCKKVRRWL